MLSLEKKCRGKRSVVSRGKIPVVPIAWHREGNHVHKADPHCSFQAEGKDNVLPGLAPSMVALKTQLLLPALSDLVWPRADLFEGVGQEPPKVTSRLSDPVPHGTHRVPHASITQPSWCVTNLWHSWLPARVQSHFPAGYMILRRTLQEEDPQADQQLPHTYTTCDLRGVTHRPILSDSTNETPVFVDLQSFPVTKCSHWLDVLTYAAIPSAGHSY